MNFDDMHHFTFHEDPGHGWLEVTLADVAEVGLNPFSFSNCSYIRGSRLYLEEDCDAPLFLKYAREKYEKGSIKIITELYDDDCFVRDLNHLPSAL